MIRKIKKEDIDRIIEIELKTLNTTLGKENFILALDNMMSYYYAYLIDDKIVAYISTVFDGEVIEILNICVDVEYQNKGIGFKLINYVLNELRDASRAILDVRKSNERAIHLYEKLGFKKIHVRKNYYNNSEDAIMYELKIK